MNTKNFVHLHVHGEGSPDGLGTIPRLVNGASSRGFTALALTDHGTLCSSVMFDLACKEHGIKPIQGLEAYIEVDGKIGHMTLLADGDIGFHNIVTLNNRGHAGSGKRPSFPIDDLIKHNEGIILLSGCIASPLNEMPLSDAIHLGAKLKGVFGSRFFAEVMFIADSDTHTRPLILAERLGIKPVVTNDVHFPFKDDSELHPILTSMRAGYTYNAEGCWLRSPSEILTASKGKVGADKVVEMMQRAFAIAYKITPVTLTREARLPEIEHADEQLGTLIDENLIRYCKSLNLEERKKAHARARFEYSIIQSMGFQSYFLILYDLVSYAKKNGSRIGPGRGSGAGSFLLYLLGITYINPLEYGLSFERFLNPERKGMPDVDVDFDSDTRDNVLHYARKKWGAIPVATYSTYSHKMLVHDLAKVLRLPRTDDRSAAEDGHHSEAFGRLCEANPLFQNAYDAMMGQIRHKGKHAGGVVITDAVIPLERAGSEIVAAWTEGDHKELSYAGVVKYDLLGLTALSVLRRLEKETGKIAHKPMDGSEVFKLFRDGDLIGIFQFSGSPGIVNLTKRIAPTTFGDLVAINALYRPGALDVGTADKYPEWKKDPRIGPKWMADIIAPTYGVIVYQEQVMEIFARATGGSLGQADLARRVIVRSKTGDPKWEAEFAAIEIEFVNAAISNHSMSEYDAKQLWAELASHSRYSFNKSHAVAYAMIAWEMAWWKFYYPIKFFTAMLNVDTGDAQTYLFDAIKRGIDICPPHVNVSTSQYENDGKKIFMPFTSIKYLGMPTANAIVASRHKNGNFISLNDFASRLTRREATARAREGLLALGAFSGIKCKGDPKEVLQLKPTIEPFDDNRYQRQRKYLGFVLPDIDAMKLIEVTSGGYVAGIISSMKNKSSKWGPYTVFYMQPVGIFWIRGHHDINIGDIISVKVRTESGKALSYKKIG